MIDDEQQELASLHALGTLRGEELHRFEAACAASPELENLVTSLREMADGLAHALPPVTPPPSLRARILSEESPPVTGVSGFPQNVIPFIAPMKSKGSRTLTAVALAALVPAGAAVYFAMQSTGERKGREAAEAKVTELRNERDALQSERIKLIQSRAAAANSLAAAEKAIGELRTESARQKGDLAALTNLKNELDKVVQELKARQLFDEAQIALLSPAPKSGAPKAVAVSVWSQAKQNGVFVVQNLPALKPDRNYQLWVFDGKTPVSGGLLTVDATGAGRIEFKARKPIIDPQNFAVTNEPLGEHENPAGTLVLVGQK